MGQIETKIKNLKQKEILLATWNDQKPTNQPLTLPIEIISEILEYLTPEELRKLTLVSRFFRSMLSDEYYWRRFPNSKEKFCYARIKLSYELIIKSAKYYELLELKKLVQSADSEPPKTFFQDIGPEIDQENAPEDLIDPQSVWNAITTTKFLLIKLPDNFITISNQFKKVGKSFFDLPNEVKSTFEISRDELVGWGYKDESEILEIKEGLPDQFPWPKESPLFPSAENAKRDVLPVAGIFRIISRALLLILSQVREINAKPVQTSCFNPETDSYDPQLKLLYKSIGDEEKQKEFSLLRISKFRKVEAQYKSDRIDGSIFTLSTKVPGIVVNSKQVSIFMRDRDLVLIPGILLGQSGILNPIFSIPNYHMHPNMKCFGFQYRLRPNLTNPYYRTNMTFVDFLRKWGYSTEEKYPWRPV